METPGHISVYIYIDIHMYGWRQFVICVGAWSLGGQLRMFGRFGFRGLAFRFWCLLRIWGCPKIGDPNIAP